MQDVKVAKTLRMIYDYQWRMEDLHLQLIKKYIFSFFNLVF